MTELTIACGQYDRSVAEMSLWRQLAALPSAHHRHQVRKLTIMRSVNIVHMVVSIRTYNPALRASSMAEDRLDIIVR